MYAAGELLHLPPLRLFAQRSTLWTLQGLFCLASLQAELTLTVLHAFLSDESRVWRLLAVLAEQAGLETLFWQGLALLGLCSCLSHVVSTGRR